MSDSSDTEQINKTVRKLPVPVSNQIVRIKYTNKAGIQSNTCFYPGCSGIIPAQLFRAKALTDIVSSGVFVYFMCIYPIY